MAKVSARLRKLCLALPQAEERETWDHATFRVRDKIFCMQTERDDRPALTCKAPPGSQAVLVGADGKRFFVPAYVGPKGWIGMWIDHGVDWNEAGKLITRSFEMTAPKKLLKQAEQAASQTSKKASASQRAKTRKTATRRATRKPAKSAQPTKKRPVR